MILGSLLGAHNDSSCKCPVQEPLFCLWLGSGCLENAKIPVLSNYVLQWCGGCTRSMREARRAPIQGPRTAGGGGQSALSATRRSTSSVHAWRHAATYEHITAPRGRHPHRETPFLAAPGDATLPRLQGRLSHHVYRNPRVCCQRRNILALEIMFFYGSAERFSGVLL